MVGDPNGHILHTVLPTIIAPVLIGSDLVHSFSEGIVDVKTVLGIARVLQAHKFRRVVLGAMVKDRRNVALNELPDLH